MNIGEYNTLKVSRQTVHGFYLMDEEWFEVLLPNKYVPENLKAGEDIEVFIYKDSEDRMIATTLKPKLVRNQFANLQVTDVNRFGAFLDWGLEKDLMIPYREQRYKLKPNDWQIVHLYLDEVTHRLVASCKVDKFLSNQDLTIKEGDEVDLLISKKTDLGFKAIINHQHTGLIFQNEIFQALKVGDSIKGYIKQVRLDNKIDISLQKQGYRNVIEPTAQKIVNVLKAQDGFLALTDKSSPKEISGQLGMSKKAFKRAIGALYKKRLLRLEKEGIYLVD